MYVVNFSTDSVVVKKIAKDDNELWRMICVYTNLKQQDRKILFNRLKQKDGNL